MTGFDHERFEDLPASASPRQSRLFWAATTLGILAILLLCTALILIAATRS